MLLRGCLVASIYPTLSIRFKFAKVRIRHTLPRPFITDLRSTRAFYDAMGSEICERRPLCEKPCLSPDTRGFRHFFSLSSSRSTPTRIHHAFPPASQQPSSAQAQSMSVLIPKHCREEQGLLEFSATTGIH